MKKNLNLLLSALALTALAGCTNNDVKSSSESSSKSSNEETSVSSSTSQNTTQTTYPLTLKTYDATSKEISQTYTKAPEKIITGNLSSTEMLCAFGLSNKIVGMINPDNAVTGTYKTEIDAITKLGDKKTISHEKILEKDPDLIFSRAASFSTSQATGKGALGTPEELNPLDINIYSQKASISGNVTLDYVIDDVMNIGKIFNLNEKATEIATSLTAKKAAVEAKVAAKNPSASTYKHALIMTGYGPSSEGGAETYGVFKSTLQEKALNMLGYTNYVDATVSGSNYTTENLANSNPELIVYVTSDRNAKKDEKAISLMKANSAVSEVPAVKNDKIIKVAYDDFMDYGMRIFDSISTICDFVYGK